MTDVAQWLTALCVGLGAHTLRARRYSMGRQFVVPVLAVEQAVGAELQRSESTRHAVLLQTLDRN